MKTVVLHVSGMHCNSCKLYIEDVLQGVSEIQSTIVNLPQRTVSITTSGGESEVQLVERLNQVLAPGGYILSFEKREVQRKETSVVWLALPLGLGLLATFFLVQKSGILNFGLGGTVTPVSSFLIGLVASVSSCLAVVGGLVLSLSATVSQDTLPDTKPIALFHVGRLGGFALLGGALGFLGSAVGVSYIFTAILGLVAALVMVLLGLNLMGLFTRSVVALPPGLFRAFRTIEHKTFAPLLVGIGTFFLPCGFTQAMQIAALSSGSFFLGLAIMFGFALGTFPVLALLSFGTTSFAQSKHAPLFFATAGVVVTGLGLFALTAGLAGLGIINPLFSL